jgi:aspartate kinase
MMSEVLVGSAPIAVVKVGGSVLAGAEAFRQTAVFLHNRHRASSKERLVVVVSAQKGATDNLERTAKSITRKPDATALDLLWSTGELRSVALLALHLQTLGIHAAALNIHEAGLIIPENGGSTSLASVKLDAKRLRSALATHPVVVVPGFFASNSARSVVSLGRGGSDLTAVLLARGLEACRCELIKDVPGYFTSDPHRDLYARPVSSLTFEQALEIADGGCDLVQRKAIETAAQFGLPLVVRSLDERAPITCISDREAEANWSRFFRATATAP